MKYITLLFALVSFVGCSKTFVVKEINPKRFKNKCVIKDNTQSLNKRMKISKGDCYYLSINDTIFLDNAYIWNRLNPIKKDIRFYRKKSTLLNP